MEKLVELVSEKTGLSHEHSKAAVEVVIAYVKTKLPEPIAGQLESLLDGEDGDPVFGAIKGLF